MSLTAGAILENSQYVIQSVLNQTDFGVTYQATHSYLEQSVILQTLNEVLLQRSDFAQLQQQFLIGVRSLAKRPDFPRVLDYFMEGEMPFVVLEFSPSQTLPKLSDWLDIAPEAVSKIPAAEDLCPEMPATNGLSSASIASEAPSEAIIPALTSFSEASPEDSPEDFSANPFYPAPDLEPSPPFQMNVPQTTEHPRVEAFSTGELTGTATVVVAGQEPTNPNMHSTTHDHTRSNPKDQAGRSPSSRSKSRRWLPITLAVASLMGGCLGAGLGLTLRLKSKVYQQSGISKNPVEQGTENDSSNLSSSWFSREQTFPAQQDWPVSESPSYLSPNPSAEEPIYRVNPPANYRINSSASSVPAYSAPENQPAPKANVSPEPSAAPETKPTLKPIPLLPPLSGDRSLSIEPVQPLNSVPNSGSEPIQVTPSPFAQDPLAPATPAAPVPIAPQAPTSNPLPPITPKQLPARVPNVVNQ